jgi:hypothetical protein
MDPIQVQLRSGKAQQQHLPKHGTFIASITVYAFETDKKRFVVNPYCSNCY